MWGTVNLFANPLKIKGDFKPTIQEFVLPFHLVSRLIIVEAKIDSQSGYFILDTGAPDLLMNRQYFKRKGKNLPFIEMNGQSVMSTQVTINFQLGKTKAKNRTVSALDLSALEQTTKLPIMGIIGFQQLKKYELLFDYEKKTICFFRLNRKGERLSSSFYPQLSPIIKIPFRWKGHLPVIPIKQGITELYFGIDSGAGINLIDRKKEHFLTENEPNVRLVKLLSLGKKSINTQRKVIENGTIGFYALLPMKTLACHLRAINNHLAGKKIDGIIGYEFLSQQKVAINFKLKRVSLWSKSNGIQQVYTMKKPQ